MPDYGDGHQTCHHRIVERLNREFLVHHGEFLTVEVGVTDQSVDAPPLIGTSIGDKSVLGDDAFVFFGSRFCLALRHGLVTRSAAEQALSPAQRE